MSFKYSWLYRWFFATNWKKKREALHKAAGHAMKLAQTFQDKKNKIAALNQKLEREKEPKLRELYSALSSFISATTYLVNYYMSIRNVLLELERAWLSGYELEKKQKRLLEKLKLRHNILMEKTKIYHSRQKLKVASSTTIKLLQEELKLLTSEMKLIKEEIDACKAEIKQNESLFKEHEKMFREQEKSASDLIKQVQNIMKKYADQIRALRGDPVLQSHSFWMMGREIEKDYNELRRYMRKYITA